MVSISEGARHLRRAAFVSGILQGVTVAWTVWFLDLLDPRLLPLLAVMALQALVTFGLWKLSPGVWLIALFVYGGFGILSAFAFVMILYIGLSDGWNSWHGITPTLAAFFGSYAICGVVLVVFLMRGLSAVMWKRR